MKTAGTFVCETCGPVTKTRVERRAESYTVKGEGTTIQANVRVCAKCNRGVYDRALDDENLRVAYDAYRRNHYIISAAEIRSMREGYGLSQRSLGALLGWGEVTIHRYEGGSLPDDAHSQVLRFIQDPFNLERMMKMYGHRLHQAARARLIERLAARLDEEVPEKVAQVVVRSDKPKEAGIFTGLKDFSPRALMEMMVFYAAKPGGVLKTKLNKLLWYADFTHYRLHGASISGATYVHLLYGPVPDNYGSYLAALCDNETLVSDEIDFGPDAAGEHMVGERLAATREPRADAIPPSAYAVLEAVHRRFRRTGSKEITRLSHEEVGYTATAHKERISYEYAAQLKVEIRVD
jgi:putative zinc finger/helix-turn-helix YgiT family protein